MARNLTTTSSEQIIALCEQGIYESAYGSEPIDLLARGMVESATGDLETAKDLLSRAYWSLEGEWKDRAGVQLSVAYWRGGENAEAWALLDALPASFDVLLAQAIIETDSDPGAALDLLSRAQGYDVAGHKLGRLHNQRGICFSKLGEPQKAREEYHAALYFLGDSPLRALIENNIAEDLDEVESQAVRDHAISDLSGSHLGQAYEGKARKFLEANDLVRAERYATWSIDLLTEANRRSWLMSALMLRSQILTALERPGDAINDLLRALRVAEYLGDEETRLRVTREIHSLTKIVSKEYHVRSVRLALDGSTSLRGAAKKLGISHMGLQDFMRSNDLKFKSMHRKSIIKKI